MDKKSVDELDDFFEDSGVAAVDHILIRDITDENDENNTNYVILNKRG